MHLAPALKWLPRSKHTLVGSIPWPNEKWLARIRLITPVRGTFESSTVPAASLAKSTLAKNGLTSPSCSAFAWARSRHQRDWTCEPTAESARVKGATGSLAEGYGSWGLSRGPTLTIATPVGVPPPGVVPVAELVLGTR